MQEKTLHSFWQWHKPKNSLFTTDGQAISVLNPGILNHHQGPDFINAKISINNTIYVGDIEIHIKTSGWVRHCHHLDPWYQKVILHVVWDNDQDFRLLNMPYPPYTLQLKSFYDKEQLYSTTAIPSFKELQLLASERLKRKINQFSHPELSEQEFHYQLYLSLWRACGYPHNQTAFSQFAQWVFPFLKNKNDPNTKNTILPLLSYWLKAANLWESFEQMVVYSQLSKINFRPEPCSARLFPRPISWNFGKIHPINHPALKIWEFIMLLTQSNWSQIYKSVVLVITSRYSVNKLLEALENIFTLPEPVNGVKYWHSKNRLIEWLMSAALPLCISYFKMRKEYGMEDYLNELYYTLPVGHTYYQKQFDFKFEFAWQYQGLLEWISQKKAK